MRRVIKRLPNEDDPQFLIKTFAQQRASISDDGGVRRMATDAFPAEFGFILP